MERNPAGLGHVYVNTVDGSIARFYRSRHATLTIGRFFFSSSSTKPLSANASEGAIDIRRGTIRNAARKTRREFLITRVACRQQGDDDIDRYRRSIPSCFTCSSTFVSANLSPD